MNNILATIIEQKKIEIAVLDSPMVLRIAESSPYPRDFVAGIKSKNQTHSIGLIAELKRASPSKGIFDLDMDLIQVADIYLKNGASAISVLTDEKFFLGNIETLRILRFEQEISLPLLRKDFIIDEVQIFEARANGADAILLIAAALEDGKQLANLHACALAFGLTPIVEVHNEKEIDRVLLIDGLKVIGINNRDLSSFSVSLSTTERLRPMIPEGITTIAESGIFTAADVDRLAKTKIDAILVGEALITAPSIALKVRELASSTGEN